METTDLTPERKRRHWPAAVALVSAGLLAGGVLAGSLSASAATNPTPSTSSAAATSPEANETHGDRSNEAALTGSAADSVKAAVLAKYPGAAVDRLESDSAGAYEAHIVTSAGQRLNVAVDKAFVVTGASQGRGMHGRSNTDPAHEAAESPAHAAEEKARDAATSSSG